MRASRSPFHSSIFLTAQANHPGSGDRQVDELTHAHPREVIDDEDLTNDTERMAERLCAFIGLKSEPDRMVSLAD